MSTASIRQHAARLGVPESQIVRDVLISHALVALEGEEGFVFFGGTALCRTHLPGFRLSEDIDLLADDASALRDRLDAVPGRIRRHYPDAALDWHREGATWVGHLDVRRVGRVRVQVVPNDASYRRYPTKLCEVSLRYDHLAPTATFRVPTPRAFVAMKLNAWADRRQPRDLADLYALHGRGFLDDGAVRLAAEVSPALQPHSFADATVPTQEEWTAALGAQTGEPPGRSVAFHTIRSRVAHLKGWPTVHEWSSHPGRGLR